MALDAFGVCRNCCYPGIQDYLLIWTRTKTDMVKNGCHLDVQLNKYFFETACLHEAVAVAWVYICFDDSITCQINDA